ncbi:helix-turn-helix domain-containing protein [Sandaracinus amylolyticus]|uniref:helix-turn-helix domain-containing protein n=1 Tax=Sandaracinus amylolyticus TaxID=927083 RepID=UPI001F28E32C|nr:helix-turn-helix transcriptional regulator [Sandaracinus amylolyticus]UJR81455.1 Hypothetical protein I5071_35140 [Sandaracinus amylolyticus]
MNPRELFSLWLEEQVAAGVTRTQIAVRLGCHPSQLPRFESGVRTPDLAVAFAIEDETRGWDRGPIPARSWVGLIDDSDAREVVTPRNVKRVATAGQCR